jgi:hypothetical protein
MRPRLTYANVAASLALFISLGGISYAAVTLKRNSVRSTHIKDGEVRSADIRDGSVALKDIKRGVIPTSKAGTAGPVGPAGAQGPQGVPGTPGTAIVASNTDATVTPSGTVGQYGAQTTLLSWSQPPGTVDEVHGTVRISYPAVCTDPGEGIELYVTDENGVEISPDFPTDAFPTGNSGPGENDNAGVKFGVGDVIDAAASDLIGFPIEDPIYVNGGAEPIQRKVIIKALKYGANCETESPSLGSFELFVVRSKTG